MLPEESDPSLEVLDEHLPVAVVQVAQHPAGDLQLALGRAIGHVVARGQRVAEILLEAWTAVGQAREHEAAADLDVAQAARAVVCFSGAREDAIDRLGIYRGNVVANAHKAIASAYPVVRKIVGEGFFEGLAREYLRPYPSTSGDLNAYGERLPE